MLLLLYNIFFCHTRKKKKKINVKRKFPSISSLLSGIVIKISVGGVTSPQTPPLCISNIYFLIIIHISKDQFSTITKIS